MPFPKADRDELVASARLYVHRKWPDAAFEDKAVYLAGAMVHMARRRYRKRLMIRGGVSVWPRIGPPLVPKPGEPVLFGVPHISIGRNGVMAPMPHAWVVDPEDGSIVDLTTAEWPDVCWARLGLDWPWPPMPDYWWGDIDELPALASYLEIEADTRRVIAHWLDTGGTNAEVKKR